MRISDKIREADKEISEIWRNDILENFSLLRVYYWFSILKSHRPAMRFGNEIIDDGKPKDNISFEDIYKLSHSLSLPNIQHNIKINSFVNWFLSLDEETYYEETDEDCSNFLTFAYMVRAWNDYIKEKE